MLCQNCNKVLPKGWLFCPACRSSGSSGAPPRTVAPQKVQSSHPAAQVGQSLSPQQAPLQYAGFWRRVAASIVDSLILVAVWLSLAFFFSLTAGHHVGLLIAAAVNGVISLFYEAYFTSGKWSATPGKRALKLIVLDTNAAPIGFGLAMGRSFLKIVSAFTFGIGYLMVAFTDKKQALHDFMVRTIVIRG